MGELGEAVLASEMSLEDGIMALGFLRLWHLNKGKP
jgi:hypothetical protein